MGIVLHQMPELASEAERADFLASAAADSVFVWTRTPHIAQVACPGRLSVRAAFGGRVTHSIGDARLQVDDDDYLVVNPGTACDTHSATDGVHPVGYFAVYFSDATLRRCLADYNGHVFNSGGPGAGIAEAAGALFSEQLRPHDRRVTPLIRSLASAIEHTDGNAAPAEWEAHAEELLAALLTERHLERERVAALTHARARTRQEIYRRVSAATNYLLSHYDEPVNLQQLADVACLAKFHFLRMFVAVHRVTPMEYLRCKRVAVASRLLRSDGVSLGVVARQVGVADRSTLLRLFIDYRGTTPDQYRRGLRGVPAVTNDDCLLADLVAARANSKSEAQGASHVAEPRVGLMGQVHETGGE